MPNFTVKPWAIFKHNNQYIIAKPNIPTSTETSFKKRVITFLPSNHYSAKENQANALLISLAPKLYELLARMVQDAERRSVEKKNNRIECNKELYLQAKAALRQIRRA